MFQFQNGAINRDEADAIVIPDESFNSKMVRLIACLFAIRNAFLKRFQFQNGAINSLAPVGGTESGAKFQFQNGAINRSRTDS